MERKTLKDIFLEKITHKIVVPNKGLDGPVFQYNNKTYEIISINIGAERKDAENAADKLLYTLEDEQYIVLYEKGNNNKKSQVRFAIVDGLED